MTDSTLLILIATAPAMITAAAHAIVWTFYPEAR